MSDYDINDNVYMYQVLKKVDPGMGISSKGMAIMNSLVHDMLACIATEVGRLARYNARKTMTARHVQTAMRLLLPHGLDRGAVVAGMEVVKAHRSKKVGKTTTSADAADVKEGEVEDKVEVDKAGEEEEEEAGRAEAGIEQPAAVQATSLVFPMARMKRAIKEKTLNMLMGAEATMYLTAMMGPACECARAQSVMRITPRHMQLAIRNDKPLNRFLADVILAPDASLPSLPGTRLFSPAGAAGALPGLPSLPSFPVRPAAAVPTEVQAPYVEAVPGLRRALAAADVERCDEGGTFFANPPQAALPALVAAVAAFEISQDVDELKDTLAHTLRYFSTSHF